MKALAIAALTLSLILLFVPLGGYLTVVSVGMALLSPKHFRISSAVIIVNLLNILIFSPLLRFNAIHGFDQNDPKWIIFYLLLVLVHVGAGTVLYRQYRQKKSQQAVQKPMDGDIKSDQ